MSSKTTMKRNENLLSKRAQNLVRVLRVKSKV
jgi:hypothetical protein